MQRSAPQIPGSHSPVSSVTRHVTRCRKCTNHLGLPRATTKAQMGRLIGGRAPANTSQVHPSHPQQAASTAGQRINHRPHHHHHHPHHPLPLGGSVQPLLSLLLQALTSISLMRITPVRTPMRKIHRMGMVHTSGMLRGGYWIRYSPHT